MNKNVDTMSTLKSKDQTLDIFIRKVYRHLISIQVEIFIVPTYLYWHVSVSTLLIHIT